jgi:hypothetical protein
VSVYYGFSMARVLRLDGEGAVYHVIVRGNERKAEGVIGGDRVFVYFVSGPRSPGWLLCLLAGSHGVNRALPVDTLGPIVCRGSP